MIRDAVATDVAAIASIYSHYVTASVITFEEHAVSEAEMRARIAEVSADSFPWLVAERDRQILGYAYASEWKARRAYRYSAESTIYLAPTEVGWGIGTTLYRALIERVRAAGMHVIVGCIALPNPASITLHERLGFRKVGHFTEVGHKFGRWVDVGYWQLLL